MENYREQDENLKPILDLFANGIEKLVDFGLEIVNWDTEKLDASDEHLPPILFLRNYLEKIDAISILVRHSSIDPCKSLLRTALENIIYLEYLLQKDTEQRSISFLVWNSISQQKWAEKADGSSANYKQLLSKYKKDKFMREHTPPVHPDIEKIKTNGEQLLELDRYKSTHEEYERTRKKIKNPAWYSLYDGPENMDLLCTSVDLNAIYEVLYRIFSHSVHGNDVIQGKLLPDEDGKTYIAQIRFPKDAQSITQHCYNFCILIFKTYIERRLQGKMIKYVDWHNSIREFHNRLTTEEFLKFT